jgi:hypothetical protein
VRCKIGAGKGLLTIDLKPLHVEGRDEVLPEAIELAGNISFAVNSDISPGEPCADRLINVDHVGEICPAIDAD